MKRLKPLYKFPGESRLYSFDFSNQPELKTVPPATLMTPTVTAEPPGLTIGSPTVDGSKVEVQLSAGAVSDTAYIVECTVNTDGGATLKMYGKLAMLDEAQL